MKGESVRMPKKRLSTAELKAMATTSHHKRLLDRRRRWREYQRQRRVKQAAARADAVKARKTEKALRQMGAAAVKAMDDAMGGTLAGTKSATFTVKDFTPKLVITPKLATATIDGQKGFIKSLDDAAAVNHPPHYKSNGIEAIDVIEAFKLNFNLGNSLKYILRADRKGKRLEDLKKAAWYLTREVEASGE